MQHHITTTSLSGSTLLSFICFAVAIPFLAAMPMINQFQAAHRHISNEDFFGLFKGLGFLAAVTGTR